jgi:fructose-1,6-bisphosphatase/inositol monophosphatase family enzyme
MCDPIDGAVQFMQGIPFWSTSLCLIHEGRPVFSLVYEPAQQELFTPYTWGSTGIIAGNATIQSAHQARLYEIAHE